MAITAGAQRGKGPYQVNGAEAVAPVALGASANILTPTGSITVTLPVDTSGNAYACYRITASGAIWFGFGSGPASANGANEWLVGPGIVMDIIPPAGATQISAFFDAASTTGSLCITGIY
jgi:hypothetical protein